MGTCFVAKSKGKAKKRSKIKAYAFIDTNIFLDFYRASEATLAMLEKLEQVRDRVICTYQVEMEFLKNRQPEIARIADQANLSLDASLPAVLSDTQLSSSVTKMRRNLKTKQTKLSNNLLKLLRNPKDDRVFRVLEEVFRSKSEHVFTRDMDVKNKIKRLARRRFQLGYPPRKSSDTSMGDAVNWEWIIHCASKMQGRFIIVSRDSDFGTTYNKEYFLNDQLRQEFRERVGQKSLVYTQRLSEALSALEVTVTEAEKESEAEEVGRLGALEIARRFHDEQLRRATLSAQLAKSFPEITLPPIRTLTMPESSTLLRLKELSEQQDAMQRALAGLTIGSIKRED